MSITLDEQAITQRAANAVEIALAEWEAMYGAMSKLERDLFVFAFLRGVGHGAQELRLHTRDIVSDVFRKQRLA